MGKKWLLWGAIPLLPIIAIIGVIILVVLLMAGHQQEKNNAGACGGGDKAQTAANSGGGGNSKTASSGDQKKEAQKVYSVLAGMGMPKENIAGILGNWQVESGIDPTSIQGIMPGGPEAYNINGPQHKAKMNDTAGGIGFGQWTGGRNVNLRNYAKQKHKNWYDDTLQLNFLAVGDDPLDKGAFMEMVHKSKGSPYEAARWYHDHWERSAAGFEPERGNNATQWMGQFGGWKADKALAKSVVGQVGDTKDAADTKQADQSKTCNTSGTDQTAGGTGKYVNPFKDVKGYQASRVDQGYDAIGSGPVYSMTSGVIVEVSSGWSGGVTSPDEWNLIKITDGPMKGKFIYYAEACKLTGGLHVGSKVTESTKLCDMNPSSVEFGWGEPPGHSHQPMATKWYHSAPGCTGNGAITNFGQNFSDLIESLGGKPGTHQAGCPTQKDPLPKGYPKWTKAKAKGKGKGK